jgi:hypothetical protein
MEVLGIGVAAFIALNKKQERIVPEPAEFQSFDLRPMGHLHHARENSAAVQCSASRLVNTRMYSRIRESGIESGLGRAEPCVEPFV